MSSDDRPSNPISSGGFLSGFIESNVELPSDGLNGECIVHYGGEHSKCEMIVTLVDGKREGEAMLVNNGVPYLKLHYERGSLTGVVERLNKDGLVDMRGHLENGMEIGLFVEYERGKKVVWIGYYRNGERYLEVRNRDMKSDCLDDGSSMFYELDENRLPTQLCLYVNGVRSRVIQKFNGSTMIEYAENERRVYEGGFKGDMENGFVREGKGKEFVNDGREAVYSGDWKNGKRDGQGTELKGFKAIYTGGWKDGKRNEEGEEMDERGKVVRSGWWVNGVWSYSLYPSSLTSNPQTIEELKIENNSYNDSSVTELKLSGLVRLKRIVIGDDCFGSVRLFELDGLNVLESVVIGQRSFTIGKDWYTIQASNRTDANTHIMNCPKLKSIRIGDYSYGDYHSFELNNLPSLQSIEIGNNCYNMAPFILTCTID